MEERNQQRTHVFAINSSVEFLNVVRELLQEEGYAVTTTNYVPDTFEGIAALHPDVLVVDVAVGQQAGWELLERLHQGAETRGIPVVVISTDPQLLDRARDQAARYGQHRYLEKPFAFDALLAAVRELTGEP